MNVGKQVDYELGKRRLNYAKLGLALGVKVRIRNSIDTFACLHVVSS